MPKYDVNPAIKTKPELQISRMLVGHDYMVNEPFRDSQKNLADMAIDLAKRLAKDNDNPIPHFAGVSTFYVDQGYVVTFAWIEWQEVDEPQSESEGE